MTKRLKVVTGRRVLLIALASTAVVGCGMFMKKPAPVTVEASEPSAAVSHTSSGSRGSSSPEELLVDPSQGDPSLKEHWLRVAQLRFDEGRYPSAMVAAEQVLKRAPGDVEAEALITLAGMRIANASVARLQADDGAVSERSRTEMTLLADALRVPAAVLAEESPPQLRAAPVRRRAAAPRAPVEDVPALPAARPAARGGASDPFRNIGN